MTENSVRSEDGNKGWHCLTHPQSIRHCLTVSIMCCLRLHN